MTTNLSTIYALATKLYLQILPSTGERSTLPFVLGFFALAIALFAIMFFLKRRDKDKDDK